MNNWKSWNTQGDTTAERMTRKEAVALAGLLETGYRHKVVNVRRNNRTLNAYARRVARTA